MSNRALTLFIAFCVMLYLFFESGAISQIENERTENTVHNEQVEPNGACANGSILSRGSCVSSAQHASCPDGYKLDGAMCVSSEFTMSCPEGYEFDGESCAYGKVK